MRIFAGKGPEEGFASLGFGNKLGGMSLESLMQEAAKLSEQESRRLSAFLVSMRASREEGHAEEMARRIDDKDPANWTTIEDLDKRFGLSS